MALDAKQFATEIRAELLPELKAAIEQEITEKLKNNGQVSPETLERILRVEQKFDRLEAIVERPEAPGRTVKEIDTPGSLVTGDERFRKWKEGGFLQEKTLRFSVGAAFPPESKIIISGGGGLTLPGAAVLSTTRVDAGSLPTIDLRVRDLLPVRQVSTAAVDFLRQASRVNNASPQVEGQAKSESNYTWEAVQVPIRTIAHYVQATRQILDDAPWLRREIDSELMYGLKLKEEQQILMGDGTGVNILGIIPQAAAYNTALNVSGDTKLDKLRHAIYQTRLALYPVDGIVLHPKELHDIDLIKTNEGSTANNGSYIVGDPKSGPMIRTLWGKSVVESDSMPIGTFLVGAFQFGAILFDRMQAVIDISFEHGTNFVENEVTIRCEERIGLGVKRTAAFTYGTF